jgi:hypothetical protein
LNPAQFESEMRILAESLEREWASKPTRNRDFKTERAWERWSRIVRNQFEPRGFVYGQFLPENDTRKTKKDVYALLQTGKPRMVFFASAAASLNRRAHRENRIMAKRGAIAKFVESNLSGDAQFLLILTTVARHSGFDATDPDTSSVLYGTAISRNGSRDLQAWAFGAKLAPRPFLPCPSSG